MLWSCLNFEAKTKVDKRTHKGSLKNLPDLEEPFPICLLTRATKIPIGPTIDVSKFSSGLMLKTDFLLSMLKSSVDLPRLL